MPRAVQFDRYGDRDVLDVREVPRPTPAEDQILVRVRAAGINPGEAKIRVGALHEMFPATFPSGEGSDLAGVVEEVGAGVDAFSPGDEVLGHVDTRSSHAEYAVVDADHAVIKPAGLSWEVAGGLFVAGSTAWAMVDAVGLRAGEAVIVAGATGGVGVIAVQLARLREATVIAIAGAGRAEWLRAHGAIPVAYGDDMTERVRAALSEAGHAAPAAMLDAYGGGYVELALALGIAPERIDTIVDFAAVHEHGVKAAGSAQGASRAVLEELSALAADGRLDIPIAATYPLEQVREAYRALEEDHPLGKIVLLP
jgi:NADPH:quinone reductase-like Zn-dependent oxidoreductase